MNTTASSRSSNPASQTNPLTREVARSNAAAASGSSATFVAFLAAQVSGAGTMFDRAAAIAPPQPSPAQADAQSSDDASDASDDAAGQDSRDAAQPSRSDDSAPATPAPGSAAQADDQPAAAASDPNAVAPALNPAAGQNALTKPDRRSGAQPSSPKAASADASPESAAPTDPLGLIPGRSGASAGDARAQGDAGGAPSSAPNAPAEAAQASGPRFSEHLSNSAPAESSPAASAAADGAQAPSATSSTSAATTTNPQASPSAAASPTPGPTAGPGQSPAAAGSGPRTSTTPSTPLVGIAATPGPSPLGKLVGGPLSGQIGAGPRLTAQEAETQGQVARGLASALKAKDGEVTLRLTPDTLGTVRITLRIEDQQVRATIETSTLAARDLLSKGVESLRAGLERRGLEVDRLEVRAAPEALPTAPPARSESGTGHEQPPSSRDFSHGGGSGGGGDHPGEDRRNFAGASPHGLVGDDAASTPGLHGVAGPVHQGPTLSLERDGSATTLPDGRTVQALRLEAVA